MNKTSDIKFLDIFIRNTDISTGLAIPKRLLDNDGYV